MTHFLIIRHGETLWNREHRIQGQLDSQLSPTGLAQAEALGWRLRKEGLDLLVSSDLGRTLQTAAPIAAATGLAIARDARLRERAFGVFEGMTPEEIKERRPDEYERWQSRDPEFAMQDGESLVQMRARLSACVEELAARGYAKVGLVTHGGALDALYRIATGTPYSTVRNWPLANASINDIVVENGRWQMRGWGDIAHLTASEDDFA
ncbi:MAG TPA: histidine phosphatase family protein [Burkholderiales bacterium]|jgi:probable phosphoglycerate mutase